MDWWLWRSAFCRAVFWNFNTKTSHNLQILCGKCITDKQRAPIEKHWLNVLIISQESQSYNRTTTTSERASKSDIRQRCIKEDLFRTTLCLLHLVHQLSSPILLWNFAQSFKLSTKTVSVSRCESLEIGHFYVNWVAQSETIK